MYRGREGMWAWLLHRVAGVAIAVFLLAHIVDTALVGWGPKVYNHVVKLYTNPLFRIGEVLLAAALAYHAVNGLRIIAVDFWGGRNALQRRLFYAVAIVFLLLFAPVAVVMIHEMLT